MEKIPGFLFDLLQKNLRFNLFTNPMVIYAAEIKLGYVRVDQLAFYKIYYLTFQLRNVFNRLMHVSLLMGHIAPSLQ